MYHALYRKYRPKDFDSVVGQDSIIKTLKNSIINHNFSHAYMFFGPRGIGKTTISKIFARNINCENPVDGNACGKCNSCNVSFSKSCVDVIEIDAASNNGVDEIRDLKNKIVLVPSELKYKVYIIDEVHMLSIGAFNALLKTLEEPPEHAIFILATTDPQKVPETIISRCQCFSFRRISEDVIISRLKYVCNQENIDIDDSVLKNIAMLADGGMRDALGSLDKLVSYNISSKISMEDFVEVNGIVSSDDIKDLIGDILSTNIQNVLKKLNNFNNTGKNLIQIMVQLLNIGRNELVDYYINGKELKYSVDNLQNLINLINEKMFDIKKSANTMIYIEILFLKYINDTILDKKESEIPRLISDSSENHDKKEIISQKKIEIKVKDDYVDEVKPSEKEDLDYVSNDNDVSAVDVPLKIANIDEIMRIRVNNTMALANKNLLRLEASNFELLRDFTFDQEIGYIVCALLDSKLRTVSPDNIIISYEFDSNVKQNLANIEKIIEVYNKITNSNKNIAIVSDAEWEKIKSEYISNLKNNIKYEVMSEPDVIFEDLDNNDIITSSAVELFGDIVEID